LKARWEKGFRKEMGNNGYSTPTTGKTGKRKRKEKDGWGGENKGKRFGDGKRRKNTKGGG